MDRDRNFYQSLSIDEKIAFISKLSPSAFEHFRYFTNYTLRDKQLVPPDWKGRYYIALCGRGWGKSKMGAYWIKTKVYEEQKGIAIVAPNYKDLEEVMVPAILNEFPSKHKPKYIGGNKGKIVCHNGVEILCYTSEQELRGGNFSYIWLDEMAKFCSSLPKRVKEHFQVLDFACRKGDAQFLITTTPKPWDIFIEWQDRFDRNDPLVRIVTGTMDENYALSKQAKLALHQEFDDTYLGRQEINGELIYEQPHAVFKSAWINDNRYNGTIEDFIAAVKNNDIFIKRCVIAIDPTGSNRNSSDEVGIVIILQDFSGECYVIQDLSSRMTYHEWSKVIFETYHNYKDKFPTSIVAETNFGGDLVIANIIAADASMRDAIVDVDKGGTKAYKSKIGRAGPIAAKYQRGKVHHVGKFDSLERQMVNYTGSDNEDSPDRMDALVHGLTELLITPRNTYRDVGITDVIV